MPSHLEPCGQCGHPTAWQELLFRAGQWVCVPCFVKDQHRDIVRDARPEIEGEGVTL